MTSKFAILFASLGAAAFAEAPTEAMLTLQPIVFRAADGTEVMAERGRLRVPERRDRPEGRTIDLAFVRFRATTPRPGPPIVYLAGGPGTSGIESARGCRFELFMALRAAGDVIALDQRGAGSSDPLHTSVRLDLPLDEPLTDGTLPKALDHIRQKAAEAAAEVTAQGIDLTAYNTIAIADDLNDLRKALGAEKLSLWGISYGTHLALATMRRHGEHLHRVVLAGVEGPDHTYKLPTYSQTVLEELSRQCAAHPVMGDKVPDLMALIESIINRLERHPETVKLRKNGESVDVALGPLDFTTILAGTLGSSEAMRHIPAVMLKISDGDYSAFAQRILMRRRGSVGSPMHWAVDTASGVSQDRLDRIEALAPKCLLGDAATLHLRDAGKGWGVPDLGDEFRRPVYSDLPVLCISGTLDGRTPPANAEEILTTLPNGRHLIIENAAHSNDLFCSSPLIKDAILAFLLDRPLPTTHIQLPPLDFITPEQLDSGH